MTDTTTPPKPFAERLVNLIDEGYAHLRREPLRPTLVNIWLMKARTALAVMYGRDSPEIDYWCPGTAADRTSPENYRLQRRLHRLEHLAQLIAVPRGSKVFIGHGRSGEWLKLANFLTTRLKLACEEFNVEVIAGTQITERIETMLQNASMAFLVMTSEDQHADNSLHARENVVHEIGLFQARLGARRAIVMLEQGCSRFSNLDGLTTIGFPSNAIQASFEEVRKVLEREGLIPEIS